MTPRIYILTVFFQMAAAGIGLFSCANDDDCNEGYSCHEEVCTRCMSCSLILRKGSNCTVDFNNCKDCLDGFEEITVTESSTAIKPCKPVRLKDQLITHKCSSDDTCPPDHYCHKQSCVKCFNCSLVNRLSFVEKCAKEMSDCGSCANGYEEVAVTADTDFKLCEKQSVFTVPKFTHIYSTSFRSILIAFSVLQVVFVGLSLCFFWKKRSAHILVKSQCPKLPSAPPLEMCYTEHITKLEESKPEVALMVEKCQQAKVFKQPDAPYYYKEEVMERGSNHSPEGGSDVQDSNTQLWSSNNGSEEERRTMCQPRIFIHSYEGPRLDNSIAEVTDEESEHEAPVILITEDDITEAQNAPVQDENSNDCLPETNNSQQESSSK